MDAAILATPELWVVSGLSGAGKTIALRTLEDLHFYCIDNLPAALLSDCAKRTLLSSPSSYPRVAIGIDARNRPEELQQLPQMLSELAALGVTTKLIFLQAADDILLKRFSETRRRHPLSEGGLSLPEAMAKERALLRPLGQISDNVIDTSELNVHQLRREVITQLGTESAELSVLFESFAYKRGVPTDADFVFDARSLPNPHWIATLRPLSGRDAPVREYLAAQPQVELFIADISAFLTRWMPDAKSAERSYVTIAVGCTGGRHRSVYIVERLSEFFRESRSAVLSFHRELV
jgi:RNase adapter protein RapZ